MQKKEIRNSTTHLTLGYYAKSTEIRWNMIKSYAFLVLIIIIMPTFGFTYLRQVLDNLFKDDITDATRMWQCFFLADSGKRPFFNYVQLYLHETDLLFRYLSHHLTWYLWFSLHFSQFLFVVIIKLFFTDMKIKTKTI